MRVLQLIDSLRPGGAEKMAVNIANALLPHLEGSYLCCTRQEGMLKNEIKPEVDYLFLNKKGRLDLNAFAGLRKYIKENKIDIVHAHSTSFFMAGILKLSGGKFDLIWHDHYGESELLENRKFLILRIFSKFFEGIISVNATLKVWALQYLHCKNVLELNNFIPDTDHLIESKLKLRGLKSDFRIICVANLRPQKDHFNLLKAFENLDPNYEVSLHLIGEDPETNYSNSFIEAIKKSSLNDKIFYYGTQSEIISLLRQANLGVLASRSEGLPLVLLEYGIAGLPVISTDVGKCSEVLNGYGNLVEKENAAALSNGIVEYISNKEKMKCDAQNFQQYVKNFFSQEQFIYQLNDFYKRLK